MKQDLISVLHSLSTESKEPGDLQDVLTRIAATAQNSFAASFCVIFPINPITELFLQESPTVVGKLTNARSKDFRYPRDDGLTKKILKKRILPVENMSKAYTSPIADAELVESFVGVGLYTKKHRKPLAVMYLDYRNPMRFDAEYINNLTLFADIASTELQNTWFIRRYRAITMIGQDINENFENIDRMFEKVYEHMKGILDVSYTFSLLDYDSPTKKATLFLIEEGKKEIKENFLLLENSVSSWVIENLRPISTNDFYKEKLPEGVQAVHIEGTAFRERSTIFVPIKITNKPFGVLSIQHPKKKFFDGEDKQILELLANHIALALYNSRLLEDLRSRRLKELSDLREIDRELTQSADRSKVKQTIQTILERTTKHINADTGVILLYNRKHNAIEAAAAIGENLRPLKEQVYPLDQFQGIAKTAFEAKTSIKIDNVRTDPKWKDKYSENSPNTVSEMDIPLVLAGEAIGVMNFESSREYAFSQDDENFMETLAGQAVIAIKNAFDYEIAQRIAKEREALIDIVNTLLLQTDPNEIFRIILKKALEITETSKGTINTCNDDKREFRIAAHSGLNPEWDNRVQTYDEGIIGRVAREKRLIRIDQISVHPLREEFLDAFSGEEESELAVPILDGDNVMGVINLESENPYHFEEDDVELIKSLASLCAIALKNADIVHQKQLASIGLITGDIAHKMNSPLSKIRKQVELVQGNCQEALTGNEYLADKITQIDKMLSETLSMIQTTVNGAKRSFAEIEKTSLKRCVNKALDEIGEQENIVIEDTISTQKGRLEVLATPELTNVFHNLISNAIRAMPGGGRLFLTFESIDERWVIISVEDTGKGIPEEVAPLVYRVSERGEEGHGFGLPLTKAYIEMIGGIIDTPVKGRNGVGAKFTLHLRKA